jgi:hypothetical protein
MMTRKPRAAGSALQRRKEVKNMPDSLEAMKAELVEGAELLRRRYPDDNERTLLDRAMHWRSWRYQHGRWPTDQEIFPVFPVITEEKAEVDTA